MVQLELNYMNKKVKNLELFEEKRLKLLKALYKNRDEVCSRDLSEEFSLPKNLVSYHLGKLKEMGLVVEKRCGRKKRLGLNPEKEDYVKEVLEVVGLL